MRRGGRRAEPEGVGDDEGEGVHDDDADNYNRHLHSHRIADHGKRLIVNPTREGEEGARLDGLFVP